MQKRRSRMQRMGSGRHIALTARDFAIFELLARYRYLRSTYLHAFAGGASETRFKERLGDLFHEGFLDRPIAQWMFADARCRPAVHAIGQKGRAALRLRTDVSAHDACAVTAAQRQFLHTLLVCECLASIELAARACPELRFIAWSEILGRAPQLTQNAPRPKGLSLPLGGAVVPDAVFGLEYRGKRARTYRFFALEADRGTMPVSRTDGGQTSYAAKLSAYAEVLAEKRHQAQWGIPNLLVLTLTTSASRMAGMLAHPASANAAFLFKSRSESTLLRPAAGLLRDPWMRATAPPLAIGQS